MKAKAITLWQPWATLVAIGAKRIETRSWSTKHRGALVIHAAKTRAGINSVHDGLFGKTLYDGGYGYGLAELPFGCVVATCRISQVVPTEMALRIWGLSDNEKAFGDYGPGRFAWELWSIKEVKPPVPARGYRGLWNIDFEVAE